MSDVLTSGTFWGGLIGLVGVLSGFVAPALHERRQTDAEWKRARRLILAELDRLRFAVELLAEEVPKHGLPPTEVATDFLATDRWEAYQATISDSDRLPADDWKQLSAAFRMVEMLRQGIVLGEEPDDGWKQRLAAMNGILAHAADGLAGVKLPSRWRRSD